MRVMKTTLIEKMYHPLMQDIFCLHCRYVHILNESPKGALYCLKVQRVRTCQSRNFELKS